MSATAVATPSVPAVQPKNGLGVAGMVCGIVGIVLAFIPFAFFIALPLGLLAMVFGGIGIRRARRGEATNQGMAITGLITGLIALIVSIIAFAAMNSAINAVDNAVNNANTATSPAAYVRARQQVDSQQHHLIHQGILVTNQ